MASKNFFVDTNVLIDDPTCIKILQNGEENQVYIPWTVIQELDKLKGVLKTRHKAQEVIRALDEEDKNVHLLENLQITQDNSTPDDIILEEILASSIQDPIIVTNDIMLRIKAKQKHIAAEQYKTSVPFKAESQKYTGFVDKFKGTLVTNCFYWDEGKMYFHGYKEDKLIDYENSPWTLAPRTQYQNAAMELMLTDSINLVTIQSSAGYGKSYIALACALELVLQQKKFRKIFVIKPNIEIGHELGFLPGNLDSKLDPYFRNIHDLVLKLHELRPANKLFKKKEKDGEEPNVTEISTLNKSKIEYIPINFLRGYNFSDCVVIIDEFQNFTRNEAKTILTRMGDNVKCILTGDTEQIDNVACNPENNGLNWTVKFLKGQKTYAHIVLKGQHSRGPITDLILKWWEKS